MLAVKFIQPDGSEQVLKARAGETLMRVAQIGRVPGIVGDCGGHCTCATCHVYLDGEWGDRVLPPSRDETDMIECTINPNERSRLSCQIMLTSDLDGLTVHVPEAQM